MKYLGMPNAGADRVEAARYALLRRLAPSMRHHLVVNLQPIGMIYEVMDRRLKAPDPNLASVHDSAHKINGFARAALASCLDVVSWLAPEDGATIGVNEGVRECASLLATSLGFRGYTLRSEIGAIEGVVRRSALRSLLTGSLIHFTDELEPPCDLALTAETQARGVRLRLEFRCANGEKGFAHEAGYRALDWEDIESLASAESVEIERVPRESVSLMIPWANPAA